MTRLERMVIRVSPGNLESLSGLPASFRIAAAILCRVPRGRLDITVPDGRTFRFQGGEPGPSAEIIAHDPAFTRPALARGDIGFAEAYMERMFDTPCLATVLEYFSRNFNDAGRLAVGGLAARAVQFARHALRPNSRRGARRNIHAHYDLGNAFYERWLDPSMTYSSALFEPGVEDLEAAQTIKYRRLADALGLRPGMKVLEIGCGWGGFAELAAREYGVAVDAITISEAQHAYASRRIEAAGLNDRVRIILQDYRDVAGAYDAVASIEMLEAVGERYWPAYFEKIAQVMKPGGKAGLQVITIEDAEFAAYKARVDFIQAYIFPGGMLPSVSRMKRCAASAGLRLETERLFGASYAQTLGLWADRFEQAWPEIEPLGFDERFRRLWLYYLAYCEAGFRTGRIDVGHFTLQAS
jgi:cyclopropane-fatty-acyl-phospholipid synthase